MKAKAAKKAKPRGVWVIAYEWRGGSKLSLMWFKGAMGCADGHQDDIAAELRQRKDLRNVTGPVFIPLTRTKGKS